MSALRRDMSRGNVVGVTEEIIDTLSSTKNNKSFIDFMAKKLKESR